MTVGDCCIESGIDIRKLYGKPGLSHFITVNNEDMILPGKLGTPPVILLNKKEANVDDLVNDGDIIEISKGLDGLSANFKLADILEPSKDPISIFYQDKDRVVIQEIETVDDFLNMTIPEEQFISKEFIIYMNGHQTTLPKTGTTILINGQPAKQEQTLKDSDVIEVGNDYIPTVADAFFTKYDQYWDNTKVFFHKQPVKIQQQKYEILRNEEVLSLDSTLHKNDELYIKERKLLPAIFQDVFRYIELD